MKKIALVTFASLWASFALAANVSPVFTYDTVGKGVSIKYGAGTLATLGTYDPATGSFLLAPSAFPNPLVIPGNALVIGTVTLNSVVASATPGASFIQDASHSTASYTVTGAHALGVDLSGGTFSSFAFKSPGFTVDGNGAIIAPSVASSGPVTGVSGAFSGAVTGATGTFTGAVQGGSVVGGSVQATGTLSGVTLSNSGGIIVTGKSALTLASGATVTLSAAVPYVITGGTTSPINLTIALPASPVDGQFQSIMFLTAVTTLTWTGGTFLGNTPTTAAAGQGMSFLFNTATSQWLRVH